MTNPDPWTGATNRSEPTGPAAQQPPADWQAYDPQYRSQFPPQYTPQYPQPYPGYALYAPPAKPAPSKGRRVALGIGAAAVAAALVTAGAGIGTAISSNDTVAQQPTIGGSGGTGTGNAGGTGSGQGGGQFPGLFPGGSGSGSGSGSGNGTGTTSSTAATSTQQRGIVTITSVLKYQNAESAGTGMILTADGEVLTNNHVIDGATSVTVTDESTGRSYRADVVGTAPGSDVAVLQLRDASGLTTAKVGDKSDVGALGVGDKVTGVGNAGGTGSLTQVSGAVTALEQSITATDESGSSAENLTGLIETDAAIVSGDSGGPLYDSDGDIVGIDTAASSTNGTGAASQSYAIPIDDALTIADQIESGVETSAVHIGLPAFIGVGVADGSGSGAGISSVVADGPAADAGITAGSTITAVGGTTITSPDSLLTALGTYSPGDRVTIAWTDPEGQRHTASVTTISGPAD